MTLCFRFVAAIAAATLGSGGGGCAHESHSTPVTISLQGGSPPTCADPFRRAFYDITVAAFADGPANVDLPTFEQKAFAHFRSQAISRGGDPEALVDHLKDIPRQLIQIVKDDPKVLDSCRNFSLALSGPA